MTGFFKFNNKKIIFLNEYNNRQKGMAARNSSHPISGAFKMKEQLPSNCADIYCNAMPLFKIALVKFLFELQKGLHNQRIKVCIRPFDYDCLCFDAGVSFFINTF